MINLMIVEDNAIVRDGLVRFLSKEEDITITAVATDGAAAINHLADGTPIGVVMADWNMPDMDGMELTRLLTAQYPLVKVIILTMHSNQEYKNKARAVGAKGYILKGGEFDDLIIGIRAVANGQEVFM